MTNTSSELMKSFAILLGDDQRVGRARYEGGEVMDGLDADAMIALKDAVRVPLQQAIEIISEGVTKEHFAVPILLETRFRRALMALLDARDALT